MIKLKKHEKLQYAGETALRAPDGSLLPSVPQFIIVSDADTPSDYTLQKGERLILAGHIFNEKKKAEQRFADLKAGRKPEPREKGAPFYVVEDSKKVDKNGFSRWDHYHNSEIAKVVAEIFAQVVEAQNATL